MKNNEAIKMKFNVAQLERIIIALLSNGHNKKFANNVSRLFKLFNPSLYKTEYEKELRVYLILEITKIITENNIQEKEAILSFIDPSGKYYNDSIALLNELAEEELPENELTLLDRAISNQIKYATIVDKSDTLFDMILNLKSENYDDLEDAVGNLEKELDFLTTNVKSARESIESAKHDVSLSNSNFIDTLGKLITKQRNPASKVQTGLQYMNRMLNGGFEKQRLYVAFGPAKGFKSGFLLNAAIWAKKYNTFVTKDPTKKPVIVYLSMENTEEETIDRIWCHAFGNDSFMGNYNKVEAANMLQEAGIYTPENEALPELLIWYRPNRSINTSDLNVMLEDLKKEGKECVFLILDYIKRIRATESNKELRLELGNITNELKNIAMEQDIPILTAQQLNREAFRTLEEADSFDDKVRASDKLGVSNIGESIDIVQNCDVGFIVNKLQRRQINEEGELEYCDKYLFIKAIACRTKQPPIISFKHRFKDNNDLALIEDINLPRPISTSTDTEFIKNRIENRDGQKTKGPRSIG